MAIITISRGTFSRGKTLAERLAQRLDYPCVSREVILDAAREYEVLPEKLAEAMEKPAAAWRQEPGERTRYLNYIRAALCERAMEGNLVYHGLAGHLLLAGISHVIRVRVIADVESRISEATDRLKVGRREAMTKIEKDDMARANWTRFLYDVDWHDPTHFDVVLNLERMGIDEACEVVARMTELETFKPTTASRKALAELTLSSRVWAALASDTRTAAVEAWVAAGEGIVTIIAIPGSGQPGDAVAAVKSVANDVPGVREVRCQVGARPVTMK